MPRAVQDEVLDRLGSLGVAVEAVPDLCELAARGDSRLKEIAGGEAAWVIACYPRAVRWLFAAAGAPLSDGRVTLLNLRQQSAEAVLERLAMDFRLPIPDCRLTGAADRSDPLPVPECRFSGSAELSDRSASGQSEIGNRQSEIPWVPWFPVIDRSRCTDCRQCLGFCLFGVYGLSAEGIVQVQKPEKCKTNCPACARVCPEAAIIFPKYAAAPINGAEVRAEDLDREKMGVSPSALLSGDVYAALRKRLGRDFRLPISDSRLTGTADPPEGLPIPDSRLENGAPCAAINSNRQSAFGDRQCPADCPRAADCGPECDCECACDHCREVSGGGG